MNIVNFQETRLTSTISTSQKNCQFFNVLNILPSFSKMYEGIYLFFVRSLCIFVDILTVCYTFIHFLYYQIWVYYYFKNNGETFEHSVIEWFSKFKYKRCNKVPKCIYQFCFRWIQVSTWKRFYQTKILTSQLSLPCNWVLFQLKQIVQ